MFKSIKSKYYSIPVQVRASFWFLVCSVLQRGISVFTTPIFTRLLSTSDYGQYSVFNSWLDIISIFVTLRLYYGVFVQGLVKFGDDKKRYASSMQGLGLTLSLIWTVIYLLFKDFWNDLFDLTTVQMLAMLVMIWAAGACRFWAAEQRNEFKYRKLVALTLGVSVLKPALSIFLILHAEDKATARILGLALAELIGYSGLFFVQMARGKTFYSAKYWKHALMFNLPLIPHYLSQTVLNSSDRIMIKNMVGASEAGIYGLAYSISKIMSIFNQAMNQTLSPWMYQKIKANKAKDIETVAYPALIGIAGVNVLLIAFAPEVIAIFAPKAYHDAIWVIPPVAMSLFFTFCYHLFATFEFYYEKTMFIMVASVGGAVLNIVLNYVFIKQFGYYAAGYTTLFCYFVYAVMHYLVMRSVCNEFLGGQKIYNLKWISLISCVFLGTGFMFLFTYKNTVVRYAAIAVMTALMIWKRKLIISYCKKFMEIRKSRKKKNIKNQNDQ